MQLLNVSFRAGSETWLHPLSLTLAESEINVVLGATGAGKTTLLRVLAGLDIRCPEKSRRTDNIAGSERAGNRKRSRWGAGLVGCPRIGDS